MKLLRFPTPLSPNRSAGKAWLLRFALAAIFVGAAQSWARAATDVSNQSIRQRATDELKLDLRDHQNSISLHAAEALLALGDIEDVHSQFVDNSNSDLDVPH